LEREKAEIGDETQHNIRCAYPFENILAKLHNARPKDGVHMNDLHLNIIREEEYKLFNSIIHFQNEMKRSSKSEDH
jgi:hypothetical protein